MYTKQFDSHFVLFVVREIVNQTSDIIVMQAVQDLNLLHDEVFGTSHFAKFRAVDDFHGEQLSRSRVPYFTHFRKRALSENFSHNVTTAQRFLLGGFTVSYAVRPEALHGVRIERELVFVNISFIAWISTVVSARPSQRCHFGNFHRTRRGGRFLWRRLSRGIIWV